MKRLFILACLGVCLGIAVGILFRGKDRPKSFLKMTDEEILKTVAY